jgi:hypothetical protein
MAPLRRLGPRFGARELKSEVEAPESAASALRVRNDPVRQKFQPLNVRHLLSNRGINGGGRLAEP